MSSEEIKEHLILSSIISEIRSDIVMSDYIDSVDCNPTDMSKVVYEALAATVFDGAEALNKHLHDQAQAGLQREQWGCEDNNNAYESVLAHLNGEDPHSEDALLQGILLCVKEEDLFDALIIRRVWGKNGGIA